MIASAASGQLPCTTSDNGRLKVEVANTISNPAKHRTPRHRLTPNANGKGEVYIQSFEADCDWLVQDAAKKMSIGTINGQWPVDGDYNLVSNYDSKASRNGWVLSPAIVLEKGKEYYVSLWCYAPGYDGTHKEIKVTVGREQTADAQASTVIDYSGENACEMKEWTKIQTKFTPSEDGDYYFAISHCTKAKYVNVTGFDRFYIGTEEDKSCNKYQPLCPSLKGKESAAWQVTTTFTMAIPKKEPLWSTARKTACSYKVSRRKCHTHGYSD